MRTGVGKWSDGKPALGQAGWGQKHITLADTLDKNKPRPQPARFSSAEEISKHNVSKHSAWVRHPHLVKARHGGINLLSQQRREVRAGGPLGLSRQTDNLVQLGAPENSCFTHKKIQVDQQNMVAPTFNPSTLKTEAGNRF